MDVLADYRRRAVECEKLAQEAMTENHRQTILRIAATWRELADQRERMSLIKPGEPAAPRNG